jgi:cytoskeletal protein RodZ
MTIRNSLCASLLLGTGLLWAQAAFAADEKPKAAATGTAATKSASSVPATQPSKKAAGEKAGTAAPSSTDTGTGGNTTGYKKPSPPKVPQDAAKKAAPQQ